MEHEPSEIAFRSALLGLGLSAHESAVYLALLTIGDSTTGPVIKHTQLHRQFVYTALERLEKKGLVSSVLRRNRKVFSASHPSILLQLEEQRRGELQSLIPALIGLQKQESEALQIRVLRGREEFFNNLVTVALSAARCDHIIRIIGGAPDERFYQTVGERYEAYQQVVSRQMVRKHMIAPASSADYFKERFALEEGNLLKLVPSGLSSPSYTRITAELTTIEIYLSDVVIIQIWSKAVAQGYLEHFALLWEAGEPFVPGR